MRRLSIAASVQSALLGLTIVLAAVAAIGVAALYGARQTYEDRLSDGLRAQAAAARLLAAGVVEEATLRLAPANGGGEARTRAREAFDDALTLTGLLVSGDGISTRLVRQAGAAQQALRADPGKRGAPLAARTPVAELSARQGDLITFARKDARRRSRRALLAIVVGGSIALFLALALVASLVRSVRRPLESLVDASQRIAGGDREVRVTENDGPEELQALARSFNAMAGDIQAAAERIESERRRLDITVRSLGDAIVIVDTAGVVTAANPRAAELVPELAPGAQTGSDGVPLPAPLGAALTDEATVERDGRTLAVTAARLEQESGYVWTVRDVSERARLERLKSEFVATASHELRSPLTSIKGFVELLQASKGLKAQQREFLDIVSVSTDRLVSLVNDLLDVARVEAGGLEIQPRPMDLGETVSEVTALLSPRISEKNQHLRVHVSSNTPQAFADPDRVRQILVNLVTNAHLYTEEGGMIRVAVSGAGDEVVLEVADTGRGMKPADLDHIFERFYRAAEGETEGTGLGLSIVKSLVDLHGGSVDVQSAEGEGTTFKIALPAVSDGSSPAPSRELLQGARILIVDDEPDVAQLISRGLARFGAKCEVSLEGSEALDRLRSEEFDAATLDLLMPGMSGFDVLRTLRSDAELADLPVVVVSVFSGREAITGEWMVAKPINAGELADALCGAMAR